MGRLWGWFVLDAGVSLAVGAALGYWWCLTRRHAGQAATRAHLDALMAAERAEMAAALERAANRTGSHGEALERLVGTSGSPDRAGTAGTGPRPAEPPVSPAGVDGFTAGYHAYLAGRYGEECHDQGPTEQELTDWAIHQDHAGDGGEL